MITRRTAAAIVPEQEPGENNCSIKYFLLYINNDIVCLAIDMIYHSELHFQEVL